VNDSRPFSNGAVIGLEFEITREQISFSTSFILISRPQTIFFNEKKRIEKKVNDKELNVHV